MTAPLAALQGIKVVECGVMTVGPEATAMLGDLGAEIIKIEERVKGDPARGIAMQAGIPCDLPGGRNYFFEINNRNKRAITLDFTKPEGREIFFRLIRNADVFLQNFRVGVFERHGLDYATLSKINPRLIYVNSSGYGRQGPDATQPAIDMMALARGGWMTHIGEAHHPPLFPGNPMADQIGALTLAYGVAVALLARERLGVGQEVDASLLSGVIGVQSISIGAFLMRGKELSRPVRTKARNPLWSYYRCGDDRWIALGMSQSDRYWKDFCKAIGLPEMADDPNYDGWKNRAKNCEEIIQALDEKFATKSMREWLDIFREAGDFLIQPVVYHAELPDDPQVIANGYFQDFDHPVLGHTRMVGSPVTYSKTPAQIKTCAPEFGEHTEEVLQELGYSWEEIGEFRDKEII